MPEIVQEIGAYAGLASVVGLAVLSALYFSQARDVKRLREWAGRAPERAEGQAPAVPGRVAAQPVPKPGQPRPAAPPVPGAPAVPAAASTAGARPATAAAARPGTPAPATTPGQALPVAAAAKPAAAVPVAAAGGAATATPAKPATPGSPEQNDAAAGENTKTAEPSAPEAPQKEAPAPDAAPPVQKPPVAKPPVTKPPAPTVPAPNAGNANAASKGAPAPPVPSSARTAPPTPPVRSGAPTRIIAPPASVIPPPRRRSWYQGLLANPLYAVLAVAGVLILGAAAIFGVTQLTGSGDESSRAGQASGDTNQGAQGGEDGDGEQNGADKQRRAAAVKPGNVTVAVLNGTTVPGLATTLADQVTAAGFKPGTVANFLNQGLAESVVQYTPGHEREAAAVSRKVGIGQREAATAESRELAGDATVIVIAGGDKAP